MRKKIKVLSIGNSFSQDATRYLPEIANDAGVDFVSENLYVGGCDLETHWHNVLNNSAFYELQVGAKMVGKSSIKQALVKEKWDFVTLQQASSLSVNPSTYQPYLNELANVIRTHCPSAAIVLHQTWAYEENSYRLCQEMGYRTSFDMFADIKESYQKAAMEIKADGIIPAGELFIRLQNLGISNLHRDTYHASFGIGRYALGLLWFYFFTRHDLANVTVRSPDEAVLKEEVNIAKQCIKGMF